MSKSIEMDSLRWRKHRQGRERGEQGHGTQGEEKDAHGARLWTMPTPAAAAASRIETNLHVVDPRLSPTIPVRTLQTSNDVPASARSELGRQR